VVGVNARSWPLFPQERLGNHFIGSWVGPRTGLDGCGNSHPHRDSILTVQPVASRYTDWAIPAPSKETIFLQNCVTSDRQINYLAHTPSLIAAGQVEKCSIRYLQSTPRSRFGAKGIGPNILNLGTVDGNERYLHIPAAITPVPIQYEASSHR
jgi:hypothetical protein